MNKTHEDLLKRLLSTFRVEANEHINAMISGLIELEKATSPDKSKEVIETLFREAHSLKGAARAVNLSEIEAICQSLESAFAALKRQELMPTPPLFDLFHQASDTLSNLLISPEAARTASDKSQVRELLRLIETVSERGRPSPNPGEVSNRQDNLTLHRPEVKPPIAEQKPALSETVRIPTAKLDALFLQAEELLSARLAATQRAAEFREIKTAFAAWNKEWVKFRMAASGRKTAKLEPPQPSVQAPQLNELLESHMVFVKSFEGRLASLSHAADQDQRLLATLVDSLLEDMKTVLMLPFASILEIFPKLVRDLSRDQGKKVELCVQGEQIEVDKRILEQMKDPLIHLVRNCIDHGIEKPEEREERHKPGRGTITIAMSQRNGSHVEILVGDDGAGIDLAKVKSAAVRRGFLSEEESTKLTIKELASLVFESEVSTSPMITDISGRGLGLAIVREKVEKLGGSVSLETDPGKGTAFRILLPLSLARFRGVLVGVACHRFILSATHVERVLRVKAEEIKTAGGREAILLDGQAVSLARLGEVLEVSRPNVGNPSAENAVVVVVTSAQKRIAFLVDEVLHEQEVLVKSLGKQLSRVRNIAGATVLGTGRVAPILNIPDLMKSAVKASATARSTPSPSAKTKAETESILIAEDSITARTLLKNIFEAAGYRVKTAVDGMEAFTTLKSGEFHLVVSDVEMPRMNGFELTARIRADKKLAELPVVLVTALESREDRERGIEAGANAYIVKRSFDQGNLLEAVHRLL